MSLVHRAIAVGPLQCNCHILADDASKEAVIIDPGDDADAILAEVKELGATVKALVHTHCHIDHIAGTRDVHRETGAPILIHEADHGLYRNLKEQYAFTLRAFGLPIGPGEEALPVTGFLEDGATVAFGAHALRVVHTPGHTPGSCCLRLDDRRERRVFSGDTLFARGIGRTDLWGVSEEAEVASIRTRLLTLPPETLVFPGHGPQTRIGDEADENPYLQ